MASNRGWKKRSKLHSEREKLASPSIDHLPIVVVASEPPHVRSLSDLQPSVPNPSKCTSGPSVCASPDPTSDGTKNLSDLEIGFVFLQEHQEQYRKYKTVFDFIQDNPQGASGISSDLRDLHLLYVAKSRQILGAMEAWYKERQKNPVYNPEVSNTSRGLSIFQDNALLMENNDAGVDIANVDEEAQDETFEGFDDSVDDISFSSFDDDEGIDTATLHYLIDESTSQDTGALKAKENDGNQKGTKEAKSKDSKQGMRSQSKQKRREFMLEKWKCELKAIENGTAVPPPRAGPNWAKNRGATLRRSIGAMRNGADRKRHGTRKPTKKLYLAV
ncbi:hypothetical protein P280DRAFT_523329 [Massarina eburnea CBS 473.64]|uniref:Uncharacterized protein n=1 Tax=Massarina eburnea CBS 473.64 TaxID=1395130 RepID=A0A6A6RMA6_9PLEO|nr:hypothetical protein P280DRAFT_523329 [Massarina eburnea CBS 473.64]